MSPRRAARLEQGMEIAAQGPALGAGQIDVVEREMGGAEAAGGLAGEGGLAGALRARDGDQRRAILRAVGDAPADEVDEGRIGRQC
ncbi:MAG: hypothetical protein EON89_06110 [Brevundimonas sp.]|nr:MAG: hypothetical protein EON89_06110 [Brevundimonas sp.]